MENDITLIAASTSSAVTMEISVVIPKRYMKSSASYNFQPFGRYMNEKTTNPSYTPTEAERAAGEWLRLEVFFQATTDVTVHDQYDNDLGDLYDDAEISERDKNGTLQNIGQYLKNGAFADPVGPRVTLKQPPQLPYPDDELWVSQHTPPNGYLSDATAQQTYNNLVQKGLNSGDGNVDQCVDGFPMEKMTGRNFNITGPNTLEITWN
jgi:hypothetical protein